MRWRTSSLALAPSHALAAGPAASARRQLPGARHRHLRREDIHGRTRGQTVSGTLLLIAVHDFLLFLLAVAVLHMACPKLSTFSLYQCSLQGELLAEIPVSSSVVYSVAWHCGQPANLLSVGGSSSRLDLCTPNFAYKDRTVALPLKG